MWILWTAFFASGVAGLSYELTWVRYLTHVLGGATAAVSATVAVFFGGMALGSWQGGRWLQGRGRPALAYAGLEATIGVVGLLLPLAFGVLDRVLAARPASASIVEPLLASTAVLLLPAALLGATFPAMVATLRRVAGPTRSTALPYGLNTLGAVLGCLAVSLWWLPQLGLRTTSTALGGLNLLVAAALVLAHRRGWLPTEAAAVTNPARTSVGAETSSVPAPPAAPRLSPTRALALASAAGFIAIATEVQWVRALSLSVPATVYVFAMVLAAYLVGIGLGSSAIARLHRDRGPRTGELLGAYVLAGLGCLVALNLFPAIGPWSLRLLSDGVLRSFAAYLGWIGGISVLVMLPATVAMGAALPILVGLASADDRAESTTTSTAGRIYASNTLGGVIGSLLGTFWLMPTLGLSRSLAALALAYLALALAVPRIAAGPLRSARHGLMALLVVGTVVVALDLQPEVNALRDRPDARLLHYRDSPSGTVAVYEQADGTRSLRIDNQYTLSDTAPATVAMQERLGLLPMALHPAPRRALLVGFATGTTLAAMATSPELEQLDCVEIHDEVFALAPYFAGANRQVWRHPAVTLVEGDGRRFLARPGPAYDVVVEDLFVPRNAGVGALYSVDHLRAVERRLAPGGVLVLWLPLWQLGPEELRSIVRSTLEVFPRAQGWMVPHSAQRPILGLVAGVADDATTEVSIDPRAQPPGAAPERGWRVLDASQLHAFAQGAALNTLDHPVVEYSAPRSMMQAKIEGRSLLSQTLERLPPLRPAR
ncbi:MAG: fused MFS/spermidine synthase [Nannocystaceae bacterium]